MSIICLTAFLYGCQYINKCYYFSLPLSCEFFLFMPLPSCISSQPVECIIGWAECSIYDQATPAMNQQQQRRSFHEESNGKCGGDDFYRAPLVS